MRRKITTYLPLVCALIIIFLLLFMAIFPNLITPYGRKESFEIFLGVSPQHICGTNDLGYDVFTEIVYALRNTLIVGVLSSLISLIISLVFGMIAGYFNNLFSKCLEVIIKVSLFIPSLIIAICFTAIFKNNLFYEVLIIGFTTWASSSRIFMSKTRELKKSEFIQTLILEGYSSPRIIFYHILPNLSEIIVARLISLISRAIIFESTLAFLGLGNITYPSLGTMMYLSRKVGAFSSGAYHTLVFPSLMILIINLALVLLLKYFENRSRLIKGGTLNVR